MQQTTAPDGVWEALWPVVQATLTPELLGAFAVTIAGTHAVKIMAAAVLPKVTKTLTAWRAFCTAVSVGIGTIAGLMVWLVSGAGWAAVPIVAVGSGLVWRLGLVLLPVKISQALMTDTDRKWRKES